MIGLARWCFVHRKSVITGWLLVLIAVIGLSQTIGSSFTATGRPSSGSNARQSPISWASQSEGTPRAQAVPLSPAVALSPGAALLRAAPPRAGSRAVPSRRARSPDASMSSAARKGSARGCGDAMPRS